MTCDRCKAPHDPQLCTGHVDDTDGARQCRKRPIRGGTVCPTHGGSAPQVKAAAAERLVEARIAEVARDLAGEPVTDPVTWLAETAGRVRAVAELLRGEVERMSELTAWSGAQGEQVKALVGAYERALDRSVKTGEAMARLGLEERAVRLEEARGRLLAAGLGWFLERLGLAGDESARALMGEVLSALSEGRELTGGG